MFTGITGYGLRRIAVLTATVTLAGGCGHGDSSATGGDPTGGASASSPTTSASGPEVGAIRSVPEPPTTPAESTPEVATTTPERTTPPPRTPDAGPRGVWEGTATIVVNYYAPCGSGFDWIHLGAQTYRQPVQVAAEDPVGGEDNDLRLSVSSARQTTEGGFTMVSSGRFHTTSGPLTLTYWDLRVDGTTISGTLTDSHKAEGVVQNLLYSNQTLDPCSDRLGGMLKALGMDTGARLSGRLGDRSGSLVVRGRSIDTSRGFELRLDLDRAG
ncbi:hypothetical protein ABZ436_23650 [Micromonospora matsumotoense]|uniref:hypothetical protein n=1 Tax=Micromonospora matsumotoense TaxID=121616 RepID=UPI0034067E21